MSFGYDLLPQSYAVNFPDRNFSTTFFKVKFQNDGEKKKNVRIVQLSARDVVAATQSHILENKGLQPHHLSLCLPPKSLQRALAKCLFV